MFGGMDPSADSPPAAPPTRDELVEMVARAHRGAPYAESTLAGRALAAQSRLPKLVAENLGAGFGQWDFFPEAAVVVDFALAYAPPETSDDVWALARAWAADDAAGRETVLALVGRDILMHELRRVDVAELRELLAARAAAALAMRASLGLAVPAAPAQKAAPARPRAARAAGEPRAEGGAGEPRAAVVEREAPRQRSTSETGEPMRMPKPAFVRPKPAAAPVVRRFEHPKFGQGVLEAEDGTGPEAKLTIKFEAGTKTLLARFVTELPTSS